MLVNSMSDEGFFLHRQPSCLCVTPEEGPMEFSGVSFIRCWSHSWHFHLHGLIPSQRCLLQIQYWGLGLTHKSEEGCDHSVIGSGAAFPIDGKRWKPEVREALSGTKFLWVSPNGVARILFWTGRFVSYFETTLPESRQKRNSSSSVLNGNRSAL